MSTIIPITVKKETQLQMLKIKINPSLWLIKMFIRTSDILVKIKDCLIIKPPMWYSNVVIGDIVSNKHPSSG